MATTDAIKPKGSFINQAGERVTWWPTDEPFKFRVTIDDQPLSTELLLRRYSPDTKAAK